jgi:hypothetical protein
VQVYVTSGEGGERAWTAHEQNLKRLYELSDKRYLLIDDPAEADIILIGNVREENRGATILMHPLVNRFPTKCFALSDQDHPVFLLHGLYSSSSRSLLGAGRVRTGAYTLLTDNWGNPFVEAYASCPLKPVSKDYLLTFIGRRSHPIRSAVFALQFRRPDVYIEDASTFDLWSANTDTKTDRQRYYCEMLLRSRFSLCPRGNGSGSMRLFESMLLGVAPVIISDGWIFPHGPRWSTFSIVIQERHVREIERIVCSYEAGYEEMGRLARKAYDEYFAEPAYFNYVVSNCLAICQGQPVPETLYWRLAPIIVSAYKLKDAVSLRTRLKELLAQPVREPSHSIRSATEGQTKGNV